MSVLYLDVGPDDVLHVGDMVVMVERKSGSRARLKLIGDKKVELRRKTRWVEETDAPETPARAAG